MPRTDALLQAAGSFLHPGLQKPAASERPAWTGLDIRMGAGPESRISHAMPANSQPLLSRASGINRHTRQFCQLTCLVAKKRRFRCLGPTMLPCLNWYAHYSPPCSVAFGQLRTTSTRHDRHPPWPRRQGPDHSSMLNKLIANPHSRKSDGARSLTPSPVKHEAHRRKKRPASCSLWLVSRKFVNLAMRITMEFVMTIWFRRGNVNAEHLLRKH